MSTHRLTGSRIREKRLDLGLRQAALAEAVGISASYLNLIEHNRRRIGGKLLSDLARMLGVDPSLLTDGADSDLLNQMHSAAATAKYPVEIARAEELAARYPGWSKLITAQASRLAALEDRIQTLQDRMAHDPQLAGALHDVISAVTSIRSSSSILIGQEELDADWQRRFHENIHTDSVRLAASSEALMTYLEMPEPVFDAESNPREQMEVVLAETSYHIELLEVAEPDIPAFVGTSGLKGPAAQLLQGFAEQYYADAALMPLAAFKTACVNLRYDPIALAAQFDAAFDAVLRRLSALPADDGHPPMGLVVCDSSGTVTLSKPVPGFALPRRGGACPMWPVFGALSRPAQPIRQEVILAGTSDSRFLCYAVARPTSAARFNVPPVLQSTALIISDLPEGAERPLEVGISCRICPRASCASRREPAITGSITPSVL